MLYLTKYNNKNYSIFIDKKRENMITVKYRFKEELYEGTLFDGELIKDTQNNQVYVISDIIMYKNKFILKDKTLKERIKTLNEIYDNDFVKDEMINFCKIDIKRYFGLKYMEDVYKRYFNSVPYKCTGIFFQHKTDYKKSMMYIFPEFRTNEVKIESSASNQSVNKPSNQSSANKSSNQSVNKFSSNKLVIDIKKPFNFQIKKTDLPDIYQLYYYQNNKMICLDGYAGVPDMSTSKLLREIFDTMGDTDDIKVVVKCEYSDIYNKWVPKSVTNENIGQCK